MPSDTQEPRARSSILFCPPGLCEYRVWAGPVLVDTSQARARCGGRAVGAPSMAPRHGAWSWWGMGGTPGPQPPGPRKQQRKKRMQRGWWGGQAGSFCGSVCGKVFFFLFPPFSYVKSARKLGSLFATVSGVSWGWGWRGGDPGPGTPACHLRVASYCLEMCLSLNTRLKIELGGPPSLLPNHCQNEQLQ